MKEKFVYAYEVSKELHAGSIDHSDYYTNPWECEEKARIVCETRREDIDVYKYNIRGMVAKRYARFLYRDGHAQRSGRRP